MRTMDKGVCLLALLTLCRIDYGYGDDDPLVAWQTRGHLQQGRMGLSFSVHPKKGYYWGPWSEMTSCTRTCGFGVQYRERYCKDASGKLAITKNCRGRSRQYELCNTKKCELNDDFVSKQCSSFNQKPFKGQYYNWTFVAKGESTMKTRYGRCSLVCTAIMNGRQVAVKLSDAVLDGTPCQRKRRKGVCIQSKCVPMGCDGRLRSKLTDDKCGVCAGDGSTCRVIAGRLDLNITSGYTHVLALPSGVRNAKVVKLNNALAHIVLRDDVKTVHLKKEMTNSDDGHLDFAGNSVVYQHPEFSEKRREIIKIGGPTNRILHIMAFAPEDSKFARASYKYEYTRSLLPATSGHENNDDVDIKDIYVPTSNSTTTITTTITTTTATTTATTTGTTATTATTTTITATTITEEPSIPSIQTDAHSSEINDKNSYRSQEVDWSSFWWRRYQRNNFVQQRDFNSVYPVSIEFSNFADRRYVRKEKYYWKTEGHSACSSTCETGVKTSPVQCYRSDNVAVADEFCGPFKKPTPRVSQCKGKPCPARWVASPWGACSVTCGQGTQYRTVHCWRVLGPGLDSTVRMQKCASLVVPSRERACKQIDCGAEWKVSPWSQCSSVCGRGIQTRHVWCEPEGGICANKPNEERTCDSGPCGITWVLGPWGKCSGPCGKGVQTRTIRCQNPSRQWIHERFCEEQHVRPFTIKTCGDKLECAPVWVAQNWGMCSAKCGQGEILRDIVCMRVANGQAVVLDNSSCSHIPLTINTRKICHEHDCPSKWLTSEWSECSVTCGESGRRVRGVFCYDKNDNKSTECDQSSKPSKSEKCRLPPCDRLRSSEKCVDKESTNCDLVVKVKLCRHWFYKAACCRSCQQNQIDTNAITR